MKHVFSSQTCDIMSRFSMQACALPLIELLLARMLGEDARCSLRMLLLGNEQGAAAS